MSARIVWIGPRHSDIKEIHDLFFCEIVYVSGASNDLPVSFSLQDELGIRINHNENQNKKTIDSFIERSALEIVSKYPDVQFLWYSPPDRNFNSKILANSPFLPPLPILPLINNKIKMRLMMGVHSAPIPITLLPKEDCTFATLRNLFPGFSKFVVQAEVGSGGFETILLSSEEEDINVSQLEAPALLASGYIENAIPVNIHILVGSNEVVTFQPSIQIIEPSPQGRLLFTGSDFAATSFLNPEALDRLKLSSLKIGQTLAKLGYLGVAGIDYLIKNQEVFFVEINPRFQASTFLLNAALLEGGGKSIQELHIEAMQGEMFSSTNNISMSSSYFIRHSYAPDGIFSKDGEFSLYPPDYRESPINREILKYRVESDFLSSAVTVEPGGQKGRVVFEDTILGFSHSSPPQILPSIEAHFYQHNSVKLENSIEKLAHLKFNLFSLGASVSQKALDYLYEDQNTLTMRDGIAGGLEIVLPENIHVNVPIKERFALMSPYTIDIDQTSGYVLHYSGNRVPIKIMPQPSFVGQKTNSGKSMESIGQLFTDRLCIYPFQGCLFNRKCGLGCEFCEVADYGKPKKTDIKDIVDLVCYCQDNDDINMRHILLSGGVPPNHQWGYFLSVVETIRSITNIPIYQMIIPPANLSFLNDLYHAGVDEIGFNMEIVSSNIATKIMPGKGKLSRKKYLNAMEYAVNIWGNDKGQIRSALIVGLEPLESTLHGIELLAQRGVMPILSPFRPVPSTPMSNYMPVKSDWMLKTWKQGSEIAMSHGQVLGPLCIGCQNNTISMPDGPQFRYY